MVCAGFALAFCVPGEPTAEAGASAGDGSAPSSLVARARRAEVTAPRIDRVERMCALLTTCDRLPIPSAMFPADFSTCVTRIANELSSPNAVLFSLTMRECGLQADSCASLRACALHGADPEQCKGRGRQGVVGFCDVDGRAITCWHDGVLAVRDCNRGGEQCVVANGAAKCTLGACPPGAGDGDAQFCSASNTHLVHCEKGKLASLDCTAFGLHCATDVDGAAGCATAGPGCVSTSAPRCEGGEAVGCVHGHEVRVDCEAGGLSCASSSGATAVGACAASGPASSDSCGPAERARCDGPVIRYCHAGRRRSYACKDVGFQKCDSNKNGVRCVP